MKKKTLFILSLVALFFFSACTKRSEKTIDEFFEAYNAEDYSTIEDMGYGEIGGPIADLSEYIYESIGEVEEYEEYEFKSSMEGSVKKVSLYYKCSAKEVDETVYFLFTLIEADGNEPQIKSILYSQDKSFIDGYDDNLDKAIEAAEKYYKLLKKDDSEGIYDMFDESITEDDEIVEMFFSFIDSRRSYYGRIESVEFSHVKSKFYDDKTHFDLFYKCESEDGEDFYEAISFVEAGTKFLIDDYRYGRTIDDIESVYN